MKKFMKAIAFVTVMCLAFSTVAFAAVEDGAEAELNDERVLNITVTGTGTDQVALMIVESTATDFSNPLYLNQATAVDGTATFEAVLTNAEVDAVDIYVGSATYADTKSGAWKIGDDVAITAPVTNVTITDVNCTWELYHDDSEGSTMEQSATGAVLSFDLDEIPAGVTSSQIAWEITYVVDSETGETKAKYSEAFNFAAISDVIDNGSRVAVGLAFRNGSEKSESEPVAITNIKAKIMFVGEALENGSQSVLVEDATPNED